MREEFETYYAKQSGESIADTRARGGFIIPCADGTDDGPACDCDSPGCQGWRMRFASTKREWLKAIKAHVDRSPIGWFQGRVLMHRSSTEADVIEWADVLTRMTRLGAMA
jgi:hypothetical protein